MKHVSGRRLAASLAALIALSYFSCGFCQQYPTRPIRLVVPLAPAGGNDIIARLVARELTAALRQQIVVENHPGGGSVIASMLVANAPADGYTLYILSTAFAVAPLLQTKLAFDPVRDFTPISRIAIVPGALVVHPSLPVKSVKDLIALSRARPHQITFSSSGPGGGSHLAGELFNLRAHTEMLHVPFRGSAPATSSVLSGETSLTFATPVASLPHVNAGRLRMIAVTTANRWPLLPGIPTIAESGIPGYENTVWFGLAVRAGTPQAILDRLHDELTAALAKRPIVDALARDDAIPAPETPAAFAQFLKDETAKWKPVVKRAGIAPPQ